MMQRHNNYKRAFYVVQFIELPFEGIDDYVCVPRTWVIVPPIKKKCKNKVRDQKAYVTYPKDEDPFNTRDRVKRKERCNDEWRFYVAIVKYESDSYGDAEYWIAMRNNYGPIVEKELKTTDTEPKFPLNKKLRVANRNDSLKLKDNPRKPLPRMLIKRPVLPKPNKQLDGKRMKLDDAAQSSSAVVTDANAEPGSLRQEQSIIAQDNQPLESAQTETTASDSNGTSSSAQRKDKNLQESLPIQEQQESSKPYIDVATPDTPALVIDDDEEVQPTSIEEQQVPSNQAISQLTEPPEPIREPQIQEAPSIKMTSNNQGSRMDDVLNNGPTSHHLLNSPKISAQLYSQMKEARRLIPTQKTVERKLRPMNIARNLSITEQNSSNLMDQTGSLSTCSVPTQQQHHMSSYQNQYPPTNRSNLDQDLLRKSAETNNYEPTNPSSRSIRMSTPSIGQNSIISSNPLYQISELPQQRQSQPTQQDSQQQPQKPKVRIGVSIKPKNNRQGPTLQGVTKKAPPPILTKVLNSIRPHNQYLQNEQQFQGNHNERALVNENHLSDFDNTLQTDEWWMEEDTPSTHHGANSDSDTVTDHEVLSDHEISADEAPIERTNNFYGPGISSGSSSGDRPIAAQNSTNHQTHSKVVLKQQMLDNFAALFTQMGSTLRYTTDMYNTLQSSILDTATTYKKLLGAVEEFNSAQKFASNSSSSSNRREEVSQFPEERYMKISAKANSSNTNRYSKKVANNSPKKIWRFVLPSEYDPCDTRWTLKFRTNLPGLVELMPQSGVYVSYGDVKYCQQVSKDCKSLALRLLPEVFNRNALSVCLSLTERAQASDNVRSNARPELDDHACSVLLSFVLEHGLQRGWNTDLQPILSTLHSKIQEIRFKYGVMVQC